MAIDVDDVTTPHSEPPQADLIVVAPTATRFDGDTDFHVEILIDDNNENIPAVTVESDVEAATCVLRNIVNTVSQGQETVENISTDPVEQRAHYCSKFVQDIRREQFGEGLTFGVEEQKLIDILRERQGRSLHRLSQELYTKDSHFVLELIQNADDNEYPVEGEGDGQAPTVAFIVEEDKITILNNERGFQESNVKALCDVGKSTKGIHRKGYIGE